MKQFNARTAMVFGLLLVSALALWRIGTRTPEKTVSEKIEIQSITIDYPEDGTLFPSEFPAPTWQWKDPDDTATTWKITVHFEDGTSPLHIQSSGKPIRVDDVDPRAVSPTNKPPSLSSEQASAHTWTPDTATWSAVKAHAQDSPATVVIAGYRQRDSKAVVSLGQSTIQISHDRVDAPIFYRDVPLMPSENEKGVIKPLAPQSVPLIAWRLRNVAKRKSRVLMEGLHTCANCHSFSADGKTMGMDMDGPLNDKGLYAIVDIGRRMTIRNENLVAWSSFRGKLGSKLRVGFMSQISPDAKYVITMVNDTDVEQTDYQRRKNPKDLVNNYYVANFKDYRFLQVFYPTHGILAWYDRASKHLNHLPGADDPRYVHTNAVWSPDGDYLVFARAAARDAYVEGAPPAEYANDPKETQIKFDLYRIPFNDGKGGAPEPIAGASKNGMSNSFPKISPDGRWIVFVKSRNGLLMRPDSQLYIVSAEGGKARKMNCNTSRMNSWHSFSPNGRWLVFSSKSRTPYTQMFLTHIDEAGHDSPAILIENATASNRAVNIPEFVNIPPDGIMTIETPAAEYAKHTDRAVELMKKREFAAAVPEWKKALALDPKEWRSHNSLGVALMETGEVDDAIGQYREALALNPQYAEAYNNLGEALAGKGLIEEAIVQFEMAVTLNSEYTVARTNLGMILSRTGQTKKAVAQWKKVVADNPKAADAQRNLGHALAESNAFEEASIHLKKAVALSRGKDPLALHLLGRVFADLGDATGAAKANRQALEMAIQQKNMWLAHTINAYLLAQ